MAGSPNSYLTGRQKPLRPESGGDPSLGGTIVTLVKVWGIVQLGERLPGMHKFLGSVPSSRIVLHMMAHTYNLRTWESRQKFKVILDNIVNSRPAWAA